MARCSKYITANFRDKSKFSFPHSIGFYSPVPGNGGLPLAAGAAPGAVQCGQDGCRRPSSRKSSAARTAQPPCRSAGKQSLRSESGCSRLSAAASEDAAPQIAPGPPRGRAAAGSFSAVLRGAPRCPPRPPHPPRCRLAVPREGLGPSWDRAARRRASGRCALSRVMVNAKPEPEAF